MQVSTLLLAVQLRYLDVSHSCVMSGSYRSAGADQQFSLGFELGERMRETVHINLGLLALKKCVEALNNRAPYVPYMDSKLTMVSCWPSLLVHLLSPLTIDAPVRPSC